MKTKAKALVESFYKCMPVHDGRIGSEESRTLTQAMEQLSAKQCAIVCVEELIKEQTMWQNGQTEPVLYWQDVKTEIEKL